MLFTSQPQKWPPRSKRHHAFKRSSSEARMKEIQSGATLKRGTRQLIQVNLTRAVTSRQGSKRDEGLNQGTR